MTTIGVKGGNRLNIAITAWGNRVSPVFDAARVLVVARIENRAITGRIYLPFDPDDIGDLAGLLHRRQVSTLICGAISAASADRIVAHHIRLISFVSGNTMDILDSLARRKTIDQNHMMPGCSLDYARRPAL